MTKGHGMAAQPDRYISTETLLITFACAVLLTWADVFNNGRVHAITWIAELSWRVTFFLGWAVVALGIIRWLITRFHKQTSPQYTDYEDYLRSDRWQELRREALLRDGERCRLCNSPYSLHAHHRRYADQWGLETPDDLTTLCADCHAAVHSKQGSSVG